MDRTYSGSVVLLTTAGRVVARAHAHFIAYESPNRPAIWGGGIWSAAGRLSLPAGNYKVQLSNGAIGQLTVERTLPGLAAAGSDRLSVLGSGGSAPF